MDRAPVTTPDQTIEKIELADERETARGWSWAARVLWRDGTETTHEVELSWADHDHWCHGSLPPGEAVTRVLRAGLPSVPRDRTGRRLDASIVARWLARAVGDQNAVLALFSRSPEPARPAAPTDREGR